MGDSKHFGQWLRREIDCRLLTLSQFAQQAGIPVDTLATWIYRPPRRLHGRNVMKVAMALGVSRDEVEAAIEGRATGDHCAANH